MVGVKDGDCGGVKDGDCGELVGVKDRDRVADKDGELVGVKVGELVGDRDRELVGDRDGEDVGVKDGELVGEKDEIVQFADPASETASKMVTAIQTVPLNSLNSICRCTDIIADLLTMHPLNMCKPNVTQLFVESSNRRQLLSLDCLPIYGSMKIIAMNAVNELANSGKSLVDGVTGVSGALKIGTDTAVDFAEALFDDTKEISIVFNRILVVDLDGKIISSRTHIPNDVKWLKDGLSSVDIVGNAITDTVNDIEKKLIDSWNENLATKKKVVLDFQAAATALVAEEARQNLRGSKTKQKKD